MNPVFPCTFRELQPLLPAVLPVRQLFALTRFFGLEETTEHIPFEKKLNLMA